MNSLDKAVELVLRGKADRQKDRAEVVARLESVIKECQMAMQVWQGYLAKPGAPGDQWTIISWIGAERAKQLLDINLRAKQMVEEACRLAGPEAGRFVHFDEDPVETAYRQLKQGESGGDAAKTAVERLQARMNLLRGLIERVRSAKSAAAPAKGTAKKAAAKRLPRKSPRRRPPRNRPRRKPRRRKNKRRLEIRPANPIKLPENIAGRFNVRCHPRRLPALQWHQPRSARAAQRPAELRQLPSTVVRRHAGSLERNQLPAAH